MEHSTAEALYFKEHPDHTEAQFYPIWHGPREERDALFEQLRAKYGVIDIMGNRLEAGDLIAYSIAKERSALLFMYKILEVRENGKLKAQALDMVTRWRTPSKASSLTFPESRALKIFPAVE